MELPEINNFIHVVNLAGTVPDSFVVANNHKYAIVKNKNNRQILDTSKIDAISSDILKTLKYSNQLTPAKRQQLLESLSAALNTYKGRLATTKPFWSRIAYKLGVRSHEEKKLETVIKEAGAQSLKFKRAMPILKDLGKFQAFTKSSIDPVMALPRSEMNIYYKKVLDSAPISGHDSTLVTHMRAQPIYSFVRDLKAYEKKLISSGQTVPPSLRLRIRELEFAGATLAGIEMLKLKGPQAKWGIQPTFDAMESQIQQQISSLSSPTSAKPCVLIPGGYSYQVFQNGMRHMKGHGVLYKIEQEPRGTYSFTIINTGEGSNTKKIQNRLIGTDIKYTGLKRDDLSTEFVQTLLQGLHPQTNKCKNFTQMIENIDKILLKSGHVKKTTGRVHKMQLKQSCTSKCVSSFLNEQLDAKTYRSFKVFMTEEENKKLKDIIAKPLGKTKESLTIREKKRAQAMLIHGEKILKKRKAKINK